MDNASCMVTFKTPAGYDKIIAYADDTTRFNFKNIRKAAPANRDEIKQALYGMIENSRFENCTSNEGYLQALGLKQK